MRSALLSAALLAATPAVWAEPYDRIITAITGGSNETLILERSADDPLRVDLIAVSTNRDGSRSVLRHPGILTAPSLMENPGFTPMGYGDFMLGNLGCGLCQDVGDNIVNVIYLTLGLGDDGSWRVKKYSQRWGDVDSELEMSCEVNLEIGSAEILINGKVTRSVVDERSFLLADLTDGYIPSVCALPDPYAFFGRPPDAE